MTSKHPVFDLIDRLVARQYGFDQAAQPPAAAEAPAAAAKDGDGKQDKEEVLGLIRDGMQQDTAITGALLAAMHDPRIPKGR